MGRTVFRLDVQGLRAIAVTSVVTFHAFPALLPGGFLGVDIFFVISGYLITGILVKELREGKFSIAEFYRRRVRRIFPALVVVLAFSILAGAFLLSPQAFRSLGRSVVATAFFSSNMDFWLTTDYFDGAAEFKPLLHTWSLAVEEQFYILYPPLLYVLWRYARSRLTLVLAALFALSLAVSEAMVWTAPAAAFYFAPSRGFELLSGALIATRALPALRSQKTREIVAGVGLAAIFLPLMFYTAKLPFPGLVALVPCVGTALMLHAGANGESWAAKSISTPGYLFFGNLSYSLYLWHWPILVYARHLFGGTIDWIQASVAVALAVGASVLSYRYVEQPFLAKSRRNLPALRIGGVAIGGFASLGLALFLLHGVDARFSPQSLAMFAYAKDINTRRDSCHNDSPNLRAFADNCSFGAAGVAPDVAVWGDSHGAELAVALGRRAEPLGRAVMEITSSACPPALGFASRMRPWCEPQNQRTLEGLVGDPRIKTVILVANAIRYDNVEGLRNGYQASVRALRSAGKRVVMLSQIPIVHADPPDVVGMAVRHGASLDTLGIPRAEYDGEADSWRAFLVEQAKLWGAEVYDPAATLCDAAFCRIYKDRIGVLYFNRDHLSVTGVDYVVADLAGRLYPQAVRQKAAIAPSASAAQAAAVR
jgi:peptidoglycan/LPS O-acetylase OafA/YrhL